MSENIFKKFYFIEVKIKSGIHIGTGEELFGVYDVLKDESGNFLIPGTSIAGMFFERLEKLYDFKNNDNYKYLTGKLNPDSNYASSIIFNSVILKTDENKLRKRTRTKIDQESKTAKDKSKFSYFEIMSKNNNEFDFEIKIEIDNKSLKRKSFDISEVDKYVRAVIKSWKDEGFQLGANKNLGAGNCCVENIRELIINKKNIEDYIMKDDFINNNKNNEINKEIDSIEVSKIYKEYKLKMDLKDDYGIIGLLIKDTQFEESSKKIDTKSSENDVIHNDNVHLDVFINDDKKIFIPGTVLKGVFKSFYEKYKGNEDLDKFNNIIIFNMYPENYNQESLKRIERHKEDSFSREIYEGGKFREERLFNTQFEGKIKILKEDADKYNELFDFLQKGFIHRLISIGSPACYPIFTLEEAEND